MEEERSRKADAESGWYHVSKQTGLTWLHGRIGEVGLMLCNPLPTDHSMRWAIEGDFSERGLLALTRNTHTAVWILLTCRVLNNVDV